LNYHSSSGTQKFTLMKIKSKSFTIILLILATYSFGQTGIGTSTPHASAKLDVYATNKGFLPPRIALLSTIDVATITSPATGLVVYNTNSAGSSPNAVVPGYYYWDGAKWNGLVDQGALQSFSGYVPNYAQSNASSVTRNTAGDIVVSQSITTSGRPIQIIATGDANPQSAGAWVQLQLFRDGTAIGKKLQVESSATNENVPYCLNFIDNPVAGTYMYSVRLTTDGPNFQFGEADGNQITLLELGAWSAGTMPVSKGGTGNTSYTNGSVLFSDGTNIAQNNNQLFWDNTNARLGIGTSTPNASAILDLSSTTQGVLIPRMTASQRAAIANPVAGLVVYQTNANPGNYVYNGSSWDVLSNANYGDVKTGIQTADHNGWVKLDGRAKSSLSATQQDQATTLGIGTTLPNAADAFLVQNGTALGSVSGSNSKTLTQANLPNVSFQGSTNTTGLHDHTGSVNGVYTSSGTNSGGSFPGGSGYYFKVGNLNIDQSGNHSHTVSVSSGGSGVALNITPRSLSVNTFIYLGF